MSHAENVAGLGIGLPDVAQQNNKLKCVEPLPPGKTTQVAKPKIPKKEKELCPRGEKGIGDGFGVFSFELSCDQVKI